MTSEICLVSEADIGILSAVSFFYLVQVILERAPESDHQREDDSSDSDVCNGSFFDNSSGKDVRRRIPAYVNPVCRIRISIGETFHSAAI